MTTFLLTVQSILILLLAIGYWLLMIEFHKTEEYHWFKISELDENLSWLRSGCHVLREHLPTTEEPTVEVEVEGAEGEPVYHCVLENYYSRDKRVISFTCYKDFGDKYFSEKGINIPEDEYWEFTYKLFEKVKRFLVEVKRYDSFEVQYACAYKNGSFIHIRLY